MRIVNDSCSLWTKYYPRVLTVNGTLVGLGGVCVCCSSVTQIQTYSNHWPLQTPAVATLSIRRGLYSILRQTSEDNSRVRIVQQIPTEVHDSCRGLPGVGQQMRCLFLSPFLHCFVHCHSRISCTSDVWPTHIHVRTNARISPMCAAIRTWSAAWNDVCHRTELPAGGAKWAPVEGLDVALGWDTHSWSFLSIGWLAIGPKMLSSRPDPHLCSGVLGMIWDYILGACWVWTLHRTEAWPTAACLWRYDLSASSYPEFWSLDCSSFAVKPAKFGRRIFLAEGYVAARLVWREDQCNQCCLFTLVWVYLFLVIY